MAYIQETLGNARPPAPKYNIRQSFYQPASVPRNLDLGANVHFGERFNNPTVYNSLATESSPKAAPTADYVSQYDYDPVLQKINAMGTMDAQDAEAEATNLRRQAFIDAGAGDIARDYGADENTIQAALANPNSTLAGLRKQHQMKLQSLDEALNDQNLFYSGARVKQLGEQEAGYASAQADFLRRLRELIGGINAGALNARNRAARPPAPTPPAFGPGPVPGQEGIPWQGIIHGPPDTGPYDGGLPGALLDYNGPPFSPPADYPPGMGNIPPWALQGGTPPPPPLPVFPPGLPPFIPPGLLNGPPSPLEDALGHGHVR